MVIGGAYSIDKEIRIAKGYGWWKDEQPSEKLKKEILEKIKDNKDIDIVLSHTCPYKYLPHEAFLDGIEQSKVDYGTEKFLDFIEENVNYKKWYCGHFHIDKKIDKIEFLFNNVNDFDK